jgi:glycosyltransferase involved in cell wall biosynthesis
MKLVVALEDRFLKVENTFYSHHLTFERFWNRYASVFESVVVIARVIPVDNAPNGWGIVNKNNVHVTALPQYRGPYQYLRQLWRIDKIIQQTLQWNEAVILRVPGNIGTQVWKHLRPGYPFGVEVIIDPWDDFAPGSIRCLGRQFFRWKWTNDLKKQCRQAIAVSYVTQSALQKRYPPGPDAFTTYYSSIELDSSLIINDPSARLARIGTIPNRLKGEGTPVRLGFIGSFSQGYKLPDVHIKTFAKCLSTGANLTLDMIGDGAMLVEMKNLTQQLGVAERVNFRGRLPAGKPIIDALDTFDLFLNATGSEGLPRVVIEAMSRGCPCIASNVAGTPELLEQNYLVPPGDVDALAKKILSILNNKESMVEAVKRNVRVARNYCNDVLQPRREAFYRELRQHTEQYLTHKGK